MPVGFWFMTLSVFVVNLRRVIRHEAKETKSNVLILLTLYPVSNFYFHFYVCGTNWSINEQKLACVYVRKVNIRN